eukprot:GDKH01016288.1.p1 GENE.GDKH01016288.1~~GDKH01016288.1.p1  ORF type:complete len:88 (+),score=3.85 GDKH01016288.1:1-264(+)
MSRECTFLLVGTATIEALLFPDLKEPIFGMEYATHATAASKRLEPSLMVAFERGDQPHAQLGFFVSPVQGSTDATMNGATSLCVFDA